MAYNEYFDYGDCQDTVLYYNYQDICEIETSQYSDCETSYYNYGDGYHDNCSTSYYNYSDCEQCETYVDYSNCETSYYNYGDGYHDNCSTSYYNYSDCEIITYYNYIDFCETYTDYTNHIDYTNPNTGQSWAFDGTATPDGDVASSWNSQWSGDTLTSTYISESIASLKEVRDKLQFLSENKGQQTTDTSGLSPSSGPIDDDEFNDGDPGTPEYVEDEHYDAIVNNLESLWNNLTTDSFGLSVRESGDLIDNTDWESAKTKIDELAEKDLSADYANYFDTNGPVEVDYSEYISNSYADHSDYSDYSGTKTYS